MLKNRTVHKRAIIAGFLYGLILLTACIPNSSQEELIIFAAASLTESFTELELSFEASNPNLDVVLNLGSSTMLLTQIRDSGRADIFASADLAHMRVLLDAGLVSETNTSVFARNELLIVLPTDNSAGITKIEDLALPGLRVVLALPEVPAGDYARQAIAAMEKEYGPGFETAVLQNLVSTEDNVRQVLLKVELGEADAGMVYRTDALASSDLGIISIPDEFQPTVLYSIGILGDASNRAGSQAFLDFILSNEGQVILQSWGFLPAENIDRVGAEK